MANPVKSQIVVVVRDDETNRRPIGNATCSLYTDERLSALVGTGADANAIAKILAGLQRAATKVTDDTGRADFGPQGAGSYCIVCHHFSKPLENIKIIQHSRHDELTTFIHLDLDAALTFSVTHDGKEFTDGPAWAGERVEVKVSYNKADYPELRVGFAPSLETDPNDPHIGFLKRDSAERYHQNARLFLPYVPTKGAAPPTGANPDAWLDIGKDIDIVERTPQPIAGNIGVALSRTATESTADTSFFRALLNSTEGLSFNTYLRFMDNLFCDEPIPSKFPQFEKERFGDRNEPDRDTKHYQYRGLRQLRLLPFTDSDAYRVVKAATEAFVMVNCGVLADPQPFDAGRDRAYLRQRDLPVPLQGLKQVFNADYLEFVFDGDREAARTLPYLAVIRSKLPDIAIKLYPIEAAPEDTSECHGILQHKLANPCLIELIWSYWHEEGMLVQTMNAIARRFQNVRSHERDPLANLEIDPLRPLNNLLWGWVQDEQHRLSIVRRNYEYDHHYGLRLEGKAVARMQAADSRSRFLEAFHNLLRLCAVFFKQDDDTTVKADAFPVLNALKEVHLILSQGAHNQFGDLPSTARIEMLMQQWLLARPEFREFLPTRIMTAYPEPWMDRVDAMKKLQGWTDTSVLHFRNLAMFGEQILLTIRWGHWSDVNEPLQAFNWARLLRPQIQGYSHAYRAVTGVDLAVETADTKVDATLPSVLLQRRLATQQRVA